MSQHSSSVSLQPFMLRHWKYCRNIVLLQIALIIVATELRVSRQSSLHYSLAMSRHKTLACDKNALSAFSSAWALLRHISAGWDIVLLACLKLCCDIQKLCRYRDCCIFHFFCLFYLIFQLTLAKLKVGEYSIIWHKNGSETIKNMPEKWIKNR